MDHFLSVKKVKESICSKENERERDFIVCLKHLKYLNKQNRGSGHDANTALIWTAEQRHGIHQQTHEEEEEQQWEARFDISTVSSHYVFHL